MVRITEATEFSERMNKRIDYNEADIKKIKENNKYIKAQVEEHSSSTIDFIQKQTTELAGMKRKLDGALNVMNSRFFEFESNLDYYKQQS